MFGSYVTFSGFPSRFSKCCLHSFILFCWFVAFNLGLAVLFLLLTLFIVCHAILDCLFSTESLILSILFCMYSVCSFGYMLANSFGAFFSFRAFVFVGLFFVTPDPLPLCISEDFKDNYDEQAPIFFRFWWFPSFLSLHKRLVIQNYLYQL